MDAETIQAFKDIITRISNDAIDEMAKDGIVLNSVNYQMKMADKFDRFAKLFGDK
jgi:hypothetical protein